MKASAAATTSRATRSPRLRFFNIKTLPPLGSDTSAPSAPPDAALADRYSSSAVRHAVGMAPMRLITPAYVSFGIAAPRYRNLIPRSPVERIFTAMISATMDVAVNIKDAIDEAGAQKRAQQEIGRGDIKDDGEPIVHGCIRGQDHARSHGEEQQEAGQENPCHAIDIADIFEHEDAPQLGPGARSLVGAGLCGAGGHHNGRRVECILARFGPSGQIHDWPKSAVNAWLT